jgi:formylglycine-generating enzyme required for sulfatase activity
MAAVTNLSPKSERKARIFISYSRVDMEFADRLELALKERGFEPLIDREEIYAFEDWWNRIEKLIARADTVVFVLSPDSVASEVALKEVIQAASFNKRLAPIVYRHVNDSVIPEALRRLNFVFFDDPTRFIASADRLADALRTDINWIRQHTEFGEASRQWLAAGCPAGLLLQSPLLERAESWVASRPSGAPKSNGDVAAFIASSRREANRRKRRALAFGVCFALVAVGGLGFAIWSNQLYVWVRAIELIDTVVPKVLTATGEQELQSKQTFKECRSCPAMTVVPPGRFTMGSPSSEKGHFAAEGPQHIVIIATRFAVSTFEVTFDEWDACVVLKGCSFLPGDQGWGRGNRPVINVSYPDAKQYAAWLSKRTGKSYRLLSEAEFEYAARAATSTVYPWGDDPGQRNANCGGCGSPPWEGRETAPVGSFAENAFGLFDMNGNVWQWCEDFYHSDYNGAPTDGSAWVQGGDRARHVLRGGSWLHGPEWVRSAARLWMSTGSESHAQDIGFRVARTLSP